MTRAAYVHVPFCRHRCGYCNFTLIAGRDELAERYIDAVAAELSAFGEPHPVDTLFFGGGTPTHLAASELERLIEVVTRWHPLHPGAEFSVEANPADITPETVRVLADGGVNRVSLGVQSFRDEKLRVLERDHRANDIRRAVDLTRERIDNIAFDLIFAAPDETPREWEGDLNAALRLEPQHVSTYGLTWEKGTSYWSRRLRGELSPAAEEDELAMYLAAIDSLTGAGFEHYEVSNFARSGFRCRHNEAYWLGESYFAVGPGAARYVDGRRETNHRSVTTYLARIAAGRSPTAESETLDAESRARELLVFALRRIDGVERTWFEARTGRDPAELGGEPLARFVDAGFFEWRRETLRLTRRGLVISDGLWPDLLTPNVHGAR